MKHFFLLLAFLCLQFTVFSQTIQETIYFGSDSYELSEAEKNKLSALMASNPISSLQLTGHTDNQGNHEYNLVLSQNRVEAVTQYLNGLGAPLSSISSNFEGETRPVTENESDSGKQQNRRVEILATYEIIEETPSPVVHIEEEKPVVAEEAEEITVDNRSLFATLSNLHPSQIFEINPSRDTVLATRGGVIFQFYKNTIAVKDVPCKDKVQVEIWEYHNKNEFFLGNLTTTAQDRLLGSVGMFDIKVTCGETELQLKPNKEYVALMPIPNGEKKKYGVKGFYGERDADGMMDWMQSSAGNLPVANATDFGCGRYGRGGIKKPEFSWLKRLFRPKYVKRIESEYRRALAKRRRTTIADPSLICQAGVLLSDQYYVFKGSSFRPVNYDYFKEDQEMLVFKVKMNSISDTTVVKLALSNSKTMIAPTKTTNKYYKFKVPAKGSFWVVGVKWSEEDKEEVYYSIKKAKPAEKSTEISLTTKVSREELATAMERIN